MSFTIWFTGLSGAGKSTLSSLTYYEIRRRGLEAELLDGDLIRSNFTQELGFSKRDRDINVRRIGFVSHLLNKHNVVCVVAAIAPYAAMRDANRKLIESYHEVHVHCGLEVLKERDPKGLYARALAGDIPNFTGISDPYEPPAHPEVRVETHRQTEEQSFALILGHLDAQGLIPPMPRDCGDSCVETEEAMWRNRLASLGFLRTGKH